MKSRTSARQMEFTGYFDRTIESEKSRKEDGADFSADGTKSHRIGFRNVKLPACRFYRDRIADRRSGRLLSFRGSILQPI